MLLTLSRENRTDRNVTADEALERGYSQAEIAAAMKAHAVELVVADADAYRAKISTAAPGKIAEWLFKEQIARDPDNANPLELAILDQEAAARGASRAELLALIIAKADAFRQIALLVAAIEAEAKASIAAVADDAPDIETEVTQALADAKAEADAAFVAAIAQINGGS